MPKIPCKNCSDRHFKCHSNCDRYDDFRNERNNINSIIKADKNARNFYYSVATAKYR